jgi:DNA primase
VDQEKGLYNCFGCGESGDAFDLVMKERGLRLSLCGEVFERGGL